MYGRVCVVTGANAGIGKATAEGLARIGAVVVMVCRSRERGGELHVRDEDRWLRRMLGKGLHTFHTFIGRIP